MSQVSFDDFYQVPNLKFDISSVYEQIKSLECNYISGWDPTSEP